MFHSLFSHMSKYVQINDEHKQALKASFKTVSVEKKKFLIQPGDHNVPKYFVTKGCLKAYYVNDNKNVSIIQFAAENDWISDIESFFTSNKATLYVEAIEDSELLAVSHSNMECLYSRYPELVNYARLFLSKSLVLFNDRVRSKLLYDATDRYLLFLKSSRGLHSRLTSKDIANYLGITPQSLSRIKAQLNN